MTQHLLEKNYSLGVALSQNSTAAANKKKTTKHIDAKPLKDLASSRILEHRGVRKTSIDLPPQRKHENCMKAFKRPANEIDATSNTRNGTSNALARSLDNESPVRQEKKMQNDKNLSSCNGEEQKTSAHPVSILHGNDHCGQDRETKLILDCGYELLKKKGQRQEISVYPSKEASIAFTKVRSFDDLIKQLSKDFNTLTSYGGIGSPECDTADCLSKMLEKDFQKRHSDVNSMWDSSWNGSPIVFLENDEIVKDVEKHMLNGMLEEITKDLLHIAMVSA